MTRSDFVDRKRQISMQDIFQKMLSVGVVPIINENDFLTPEEFDFSDNDQLATFVAGMMKADALVLLSNVDGLYDGDPSDHHSAVVSEVHDICEAQSYVQTKKSSYGLGGMQSKINAARTLQKLGIEMHLCASHRRDVLTNVLLDKKSLGTRFVPYQKAKPNGIKIWLAAGAHTCGKIIIDDGLVSLLRKSQQAMSVLSVGIVDVIGDFTEGDAVAICSTAGERYCACGQSS